MKQITIYVIYGINDFNDSKEIQIRDSIIKEMREAIKSPSYQSDYQINFIGLNKELLKTLGQSNEWLDYSQVAGNALFFRFVTDQKREELARHELLTMQVKLRRFSLEFVEFISQEMKCRNNFPDVFDEMFSHLFLKVRAITEQSINELENEAMKLRLADSSKPNNAPQNPNTLFAAPSKNNYFKKAAAEFCIATILCGTGALLFTIEPVSASILIALGLLLYAATLYHGLSGCVEQKYNKPVAVTA